MSDDGTRPADGGLTPDVAALVDDYFARFRVEALAAGARGWEDAVADLREHVRDRLEGSTGTAEEVRRVLAELGAADVLAAAYADAAAEEDSEGTLAGGGPSKLAGRVAGVPYDLRVWDLERYASPLWNPLDRRILVPRPGIGWTVNFGALAVRTNLVSPDDEDTPFGAVPPRIVAVTLAAPLAVLAAFGALAAVSWARLPAQVPSHWDVFSGDADGYLSRGASLGWLAVLAVVPVALAAWVHLGRRPLFIRVVASALSLILTILALACFVQMLFTLDGGAGLWSMWIGSALMLVLPFVLLVVMSRIGRAAERRRDLSANSTTGRE